MNAELRAHLARLEDDVKSLKTEVDALKRFRLVVTTCWAGTLGLIGFFGDAIRKKLGL